MQTSKFSRMAMMMNRNTQFKLLSQFPSKLFSLSTNSSATRCSSTTTAAPRIAPVNSKPRSYTHGGFSPSSFLQVSLGPGNLKFNVSLLRQDLCFSTRQYKTAAGNKCMSVMKMGLSEARIKYHSSTGGSDDSKKEVNTDADMNGVNEEDNNDALAPEDSVGSSSDIQALYFWDNDNPPHTPASPGPCNENDENMEVEKKFEPKQRDDQNSVDIRNQVWDSDDPPTTPTPTIKPDHTFVPSPFAPDPPFYDPEYNPGNVPPPPPSLANENEPAESPPLDDMRGPFDDFDSFKDFFD